MDLILQFTPDEYGAALADWAWLEPLGELAPAFATAFGDVFLRDREGGYWFLDTLEATLERRWDSVEQLQEAINTREVQETLLWVGLVERAEEAGVLLDPGQIYGFRIPPVVGGAVEVENLQPAEFVIATAVLGQIAKQVMDLRRQGPVAD